MFEHLKKFNKILVTGPQRSGTRVCAKMIAHDTGYRYVDENEFRIDSLYQLWSLVYKDQRQLVVQCPALCRYVHVFGGEDSVAIILMRRDLTDIVASQKRIDWQWEQLELARYGYKLPGPVALIKYRFWASYQKGKIKNNFEIKYDDLAPHPLWIPADLRKDFAPGQTEIEPAS